MQTNTTLSIFKHLAIYLKTHYNTLLCNVVKSQKMAEMFYLIKTRNWSVLGANKLQYPLSLLGLFLGSPDEENMFLSVLQQELVN